MQFRASGNEPGEGARSGEVIGISDCRFQILDCDHCSIGQRSAAKSEIYNRRICAVWMRAFVCCDLQQDRYATDTCPSGHE